MLRIRVNRAGLLLLLGIGLAACAGDGSLGLPPSAYGPYPPPGMVHRVASAHVELFWNCSRPDSGSVSLEGVAVNPWADQPVRFLEVELVGVGGKERSVSAIKAEAPNILLHTRESTPFKLDLRTTGTEVRFDLYYQYRFQDGGRGFLLAGSPVPGAFEVAQLNRFLIRDACNETQHLAR